MAYQLEKEVVTPVAKVFPPKLLKNLRSISGLVTLDKINESLIAELIVADMKEHIDKLQYGNQKGLSIQHYLVNMIHKILTDAHSNSTEVTAVLATLIDWKDAFPNQCPKLGIDAYIQCGVRPALIPLLISYFQIIKTIMANTVPLLLLKIMSVCASFKDNYCNCYFIANI